MLMNQIRIQCFDDSILEITGRLEINQFSSNTTELVINFPNFTKDHSKYLDTITPDGIKNQTAINLLGGNTKETYPLPYELLSQHGRLQLQFVTKYGDNTVYESDRFSIAVNKTIGATDSLTIEYKDAIQTLVEGFLETTAKVDAFDERIDAEIINRDNAITTQVMNINTAMTSKEFDRIGADNMEIAIRQAAVEQLQSNITTHKDMPIIDHPNGSVTKEKLAPDAVIQFRGELPLSEPIANEYYTYGEINSFEDGTYYVSDMQCAWLGREDIWSAGYFTKYTAYFYGDYYTVLHFITIYGAILFGYYIHINDDDIITAYDWQQTRVDSASTASMAYGVTNNAVSTNGLANGAVTNTKIADYSVTGPKIADGAVSTSKINGSSIVTGLIANQAVTTAKLADYCVSTEKIINSTITNDKLTTYCVTSSNLGTDSVTTNKILDGAVTPAKIANFAPAGASSGSFQGYMDWFFAHINATDTLVSSGMSLNKITLASTANSMTISGLNFATHNRYRIHFSFLTTSGSAVDNLRLAVDGNLTSADYNIGSGANSNTLYTNMPAGSALNGWIDVSMMAGGRFHSTAVGLSGLNLSTLSPFSTAVAAQIHTRNVITPTSITLYTVTGMLDIGSYVEVYVC